ncbi:MAG: hypothetical protein WC716_14165 [Chitinophagaceae bacterium]
MNKSDLYFYIVNQAGAKSEVAQEQGDKMANDNAYQNTPHSLILLFAKWLDSQTGCTTLLLLYNLTP